MLTLILVVKNFKIKSVPHPSHVPQVCGGFKC
jgi:hypothetical protein